MKTYKITARTNGYIASRDIHFNGKTQITIKEGLSLKEARSKMLDMFNYDYEKSYSNWGLVSMNSREAGLNGEKLPYYHWDSRTFEVEEE